MKNLSSRVGKGAIIALFALTLFAGTTSITKAFSFDDLNSIINIIKGTSGSLTETQANALAAAYAASNAAQPMASSSMAAPQSAAAVPSATAATNTSTAANSAAVSSTTVATPAPATAPAMTSAPATAVPASTPSATMTTATIAPAALGDTGSNVLAIQTVLAQQGYLNATPNGIFGPKTQAAVEALQAANGLSIVGNVGPKTALVLATLFQGANVTAVNANPFTLPNTITGHGALQVLQNLAYPNQTITGNVTHIKIGSYVVKNLNTTESVNMNSLLVNFTMGGTASLSAISNVSIMNEATGTQVGATAPSISYSTGTGFSVTGMLTLAPAGSATLDIYADIAVGGAGMGSGWSSNLLAFGTGATSGAADNSGSSISGQSVSLGTTSTIMTGLVVTKNTAYPDQTVLPNTVHEKIASFTIQNDTTESVRLGAIHASPNGGTVALSDLANLEIDLNGTQVGPTYGVVGGDDYASLGSTGPVLAIGATATLTIYADVGSAPSGTIQSGTLVAATGTSGMGYLSSTSSAGNPLGQVITIHSVSTGLLIVAKNIAYTDQTVSPNTPHVKIGSYTIQNDSTTDTFHLTNLQMGWAIPGATIPLSDFSNLVPSISGVSPLTPIVPAISNNFPVSIVLVPGMSTTVDFYADLGSLNFSFQTLLVVNAVDTTTSVPVTTSVMAGQTITVGSSCAVTPTLSLPETSVPQYIASGFPTGAVNAVQETFELTSPTAATVTEMKINVAGANSATKATIGSASATFTGGVAYFTGLSIAVPPGTVGVFVPVYISYPPVGIAGLPSGTTSTASLTYMKFNCGSTTTISTPSITAPTVTLVGSDPALSLNPSTASLADGLVKIATLVVAANTTGNIAINSIPLSIASTGSTSMLSIASAANNIVIKAGGATVPTTNTTLGVTPGAPGTTTVAFSAPYGVSAGSATSFDIYATVSNVSGHEYADTLVTKLGPPSAFLWSDIAGGGVTAEWNGNLINTYPMNMSVITNE